MLEHVNKAIGSFDAELRVNILAVLSKITPVLMRGASEQEIRKCAEDLSQVSGGSGLDLISLYMWPDESLPGSLETSVLATQKRLTRYTPGKSYPYHLDTADA